VNPSEILVKIGVKLTSLPVHTKVLLGLATTLFVTELVLRTFARGTKAYARWTAGLQRLGAFWTAVILSIVYFVSVAAVGIGMKLMGKDPLDRALDPEPSFWRRHEPNPLGPLAAARHQF
jgi:hypothetical protein